MPLESIGAYLTGVLDEARMRGYRFDSGKILRPVSPRLRLKVTSGQLDHEWKHLGAKLDRRSPGDAERWRGDSVSPHPLFTVDPGPIEPWERL